MDGYHPEASSVAFSPLAYPARRDTHQIVSIMTRLVRTKDRLER